MAETTSTQRRSFRVIGGAGVADVEIVRLENAAIEVRQVDDRGQPLPGAVLCHSWDEARTHAAGILSQAIREGRV